MSATLGGDMVSCFYNNFGKCEPILIILSLLYFEINCRSKWNKMYHLSQNLLLLR